MSWLRRAPKSVRRRGLVWHGGNQWVEVYILEENTGMYRLQYGDKSPYSGPYEFWTEKAKVRELDDAAPST